MTLMPLIMEQPFGSATIHRMVTLLHQVAPFTLHITCHPGRSFGIGEKENRNICHLFDQC